MYVGYGGKGFVSMSGGTMQSSSSQPLYVGFNGTGSISQSAGNIVLSGNLYVGFSSAAGTVDLSGGSMSTSTLWVGRSFNGGTFSQSGGTNTTGELLLDSNGSYRLSAGTLNAGSFFLNGNTNASISFTGGTISTHDFLPGSMTTVNLGLGTGVLNYTGIADLSATNIIGGTFTTLTGGANSLLLLKPGFDPSQNLGSFSTSGLVHTVGSPLTIPSGTTISGSASIADHVFLDGTLSVYGLGGGVSISATGSLTANGLSVADQISGSGGNASINFTSIGNLGGVAQFAQTGGNFHAGYLTLGPKATYQLSGGTLFLNSASSSGTLDLASSSATLSASGITDIGAGTLVNASSAHLLLADNSLLIVPPGFDPHSAFATTSIGASTLIHTSGTTLEIPAGTSILAPGILQAPVNDFVDAAGTLSAWVTLAGGISVDPTGYVDLSLGTLIIEKDSTNSGGTLRAGNIDVGNTGNGHFTQTAGTTFCSAMVVGNKAGSNGTLTLDSGTVSYGFDYVGYDGNGTLEQNGGSIGSTVLVGYDKTGVGWYHLSAGIVSSSVYVGYSGTGTFIQDGTSTFAVAPSVGDGNGSHGTYLFSAGTISTGFAYVGRGGTGTFVQSGGVLNPNSLDVGAATNGAGTFLLSNGTITSGIFPLGLTVGDSGSGYMRQTGGVVSAGSLTVGNSAGNGTYELAGGSLSLQQMLIARQGHTNSLFTQTGGTNTITGSLSIATGQLAPAGTYNLQNGTLAIGSIVMGSATGGGTASFNQTGGANIIQHELALNNLSRYTLSAGTFTAGTIQLNGGTFALAPGYSGVATVNGIANSSGAIDLGNSAMVVDYSGSSSPLPAVRALVAHGFAGGLWNASGINSSIAAAVGADGTNHHKTAIGYADASTLNIGTFAGRSVDSTALLLRYTFAGDANLDGAVNTADFTALANRFNGSTQLWTDGDFNYDGHVNALDFNLLASNFGQTASAPELGSLVPEPALALVALFPLAINRRRRLK